MKETDREQLDFIIKATDIIYENIMSNITNKGVITRSRTSCNIATTVASFAAGAIWGAFVNLMSFIVLCFFTVVVFVLI